MLLSGEELTQCNICEASAKWMKNWMIKRPQNEAIRTIITKSLVFCRGATVAGPRLKVILYNFHQLSQNQHKLCLR